MRRIFLAAIAAAAINIGTAKADTIQNFTISGTETISGPSFNFPAVITGGMTLDYTLDIVTSFWIGDWAGDSIDRVQIESEFEIPTTYERGAHLDPINFSVSLSLSPDATPSDVFFAGGTISGGVGFASDDDFAQCQVFPGICSGNDILEINATATDSAPTETTPLPGSLPLALTVLIILFGAQAWRKSLKAE